MRPGHCHAAAPRTPHFKTRPSDGPTPCSFVSSVLLLLEDRDVDEQGRSDERLLHRIRRPRRVLDGVHVSFVAAFVLEAQPKVGDLPITDLVVGLGVPKVEAAIIIRESCHAHTGLDGHGDFATNDRENPGRSEQQLAEWQTRRRGKWNLCRCSKRRTEFGICARPRRRT